MSLEIALTSLSLGLLATLSPCVLPLYPGFMAFLSGNQTAATNRRGNPLLGFFVLLGVLVMMLALGGLIALLSAPIARVLAIVIPLADLAILGLGILLLANRNPFTRIPQARLPFTSHPWATAFFYGLMYGPLTLPCSGPLVVAIFAYSITPEQIINRLMVFLWFGLGFGAPLLFLSFLTVSTQSWIVRQSVRRSGLIQRLGGLLLIGVAVYDLGSNWELIRLILG